MPTSPHNAEGYIKFSFTHEPAPPPTHPALAELRRVRDELRDWGWLGVLPDGIGFGNLSVRGPDREQFVITASGTGRYVAALPEHFCAVLAWDVARNHVRCRGPLPASSESMSHGAVYAARPDAQAVIHIHDRALHARLRAAGAPATPADAEFGTPELARAIAALVPTLPAAAVLVLGGHEDGLLAFGPSLDAARAALAALRPQE